MNLVMVEESVDVLVIGAGPSGCVASSFLSRNGLNVRVVEKTQFPRFVIGESLIPRVMNHFDEAGLLPYLLDKNFEKKLGARFIRGQEICLFDFKEKFGEGWDWTWQVPRADFDFELAKGAEKNGVKIDFQSQVTGVEFLQGGESITHILAPNQEEKKIRAKFIIDSSGYGRVLPRLLNLEKASNLAPHSAIFSHIKEKKRPEGREGTLISFDIIEREVWLWVIPFSNGNTSVGIVAPTNYIEKLLENSTTAQALKKAIGLSDFYVERFGGQDFLFPPEKLMNYSCAVEKLYGDGFALTGNASEFLDPVFSSGMAFATESGILAAKLALRQIQGEKVDWQREYSDYILYGVEVFKTYIKEWYSGNLQDLFFHQPENPEVKRKICAVLAGYVWNQQNPFVTKHENIISNLAELIRMEKNK